MIDYYLIKAGLDKFLEFNKRVKSNVTTLGAVDTEGNYYECGNTACHAGMRSMSSKTGWYKTENDIHVIFSGVQSTGTKITNEDKLRFFDWMLRRSPYKDCFLNKDAQEVLDYCWFLNPEAPSNLLASAAFATRHISEWQTNFQSWLKLVESGVDETKAFFLSYYLHVTKDGLIVSPDSGGWHQPFPLERSKEYYSNFINGTPDPKGVGETFQKVRTYSRVDGVWGKQGVVSPRIFKRIKPIEAKVIDLTKLNIFWKPTLQKENTYVFSTREQIIRLITDMENVYAA